MKNIYIGLICLCYSAFLFFLSPKEKKNMLGYKSFQQNMHKDIWKWTNECFGLLTLVGSFIYLTISIILEIKDISFSSELNKYGLIYIIISFVLTECYGLIQSYRNKKTDTHL
jgi:hypothetical protein